MPWNGHSRNHHGVDQSLGVDMLQLPANALVTMAVEETGLCDFGSGPLLDGLEALVAATATEGNLSPRGAMVRTASILRLLRNRLRFEQDLKWNSEILDELLVPPVIIVGLARTGMSMLQGILSSAPDAQRLELWRMYNPAPLPCPDCGGPDPRIAEADIIARVLRAEAPEFFALRRVEATTVNEEALLLDMTFQCRSLSMWAPVSGYRAWLDAQPPEPSYMYLRRLLQYLQWQDGGARERHFVMKSTAHLGSINALLRVFPDAIVVHCHRDPCETIASCCQVIYSMRAMMCDEVDPVALGVEMLDVWSTAMERDIIQRRDPAVAQRIVDVGYRQLIHDPISIAETVYGLLGKPLSSEMMSAMEGRDRASRRYKHKDATKALGAFGLNRAAVEKAFHNYFESEAGQRFIDEPLSSRGS